MFSNDELDVISKLKGVSMDEVRKTLEDKVFDLQNQMIEKDIQIKLLIERLEKLEGIRENYFTLARYV